MSLIGCIDTLSDKCISGWAADEIACDQAAQVDIIVNSIVVATVRCEAFREDLRLVGVGDGCKGFCFDPSAYLKSGRNRLEVRYAASAALVPGGCGHWVKRRKGKISEWEAGFLAAVEAYHEFRPDHHICGIGEDAGELERILVEAEVPFRKFTRLDVPRDRTVVRLTEKVDAVLWGWSKPAPKDIRVLKDFVRDQMNNPGFLGIGFTEASEVPGHIGHAFEECGFPDVNLESIAPTPSGMSRIVAFAGGGAAAMPRAVSAPILAHVHVPKCAGTSFRVLLERHLGSRHLSLYVNDTYFVYGEEDLRCYLLRDPEIRGFSSHHVRAFPGWLAGRKMLYVTFLRDPIQQFISYMTHIKKHYSEITSPSLLDAVPPDAPQLTLREFAKWVLTQERGIPFRENHNVNFFVRHSAPAALDRLEAAKAVLETFFFVGITERMEQSMARLRELARAAGLEVPPGPTPVENTSSDQRDDLGWIHPGDEVGALLLRSVYQDRQLYDWAAARLEQIPL
jgi:hypothetical protein